MLTGWFITGILICLPEAENFPFPYQLSLITIFMLMAYAQRSVLSRKSDRPGLGGACQRNGPPVKNAHLLVNGLDRADEREI